MYKKKLIDSTVSSSIFKLKIYTKGGVLQKTLNIKGTDNLKTVLKKFDGYKYNVEDYIEVWSNIPKNIVIHGVDRDTNLNDSTNGSGGSESNGEEPPEQTTREGDLTESGNSGEASSTTEKVRL